MSAWRKLGTSYLALGAVVVADECDGVHRSTIESVAETGATYREARERLADKLERVAAELRRQP